MKISRLIGILSVLLQQDKVTAPYLAEKFEVSRRTINRDIEELCRAGIPVMTQQGANGGISIMEGYKLDNTLLSSGEMQEILAGLRSLDSVSGTNHFSLLMEKLSAGSASLIQGDQKILINLASWYKDSLAPKIGIIRQAMEDCRLLEFYYYSPNGESARCIEPYYLIFQWANWYVWGYCRKREDYRLFKLNRMEDLEVKESFEKRSGPLPDLSSEEIFPGGIRVKALFEPSCKWRLVEEFGPECFQEQPDGKLLFQGDYTNKENLVSWMISFREKGILLEPKEIRREIAEAVKLMAEHYKE